MFESTTASDRPEATIHYEEDADLATLEDETVAVIGYGNQGRSQALNLRDSGVADVIVGNRADDSRERAREDGFEAYSMEAATDRADIVLFLIPDEVMPEVFEETIRPALEPGDAISFASGYNITYEFITPPSDVDVIMIAPRMIGPAVRETYESGEGAPALVAVEQDASGRAWDRTLALAKGIGATRSGAIESSFDQETMVDLLSEQAMGPILFNAMLAKYEVELEAGIPPEIILTELYLSGEAAHTRQKMAEMGLVGQLSVHSQTSQYGQLSRSREVDREPLREFMREQLENIQDGSFAREWDREQAAGYPSFTRLMEAAWESPLIQDEQRTMERLGLGTNTSGAED